MRIAVSFLMAILVCLLGICPIASAAESPSPALGSAAFAPSPSHPFGWRGDGSGCFPGATPPTHWTDAKNIRWRATVGRSYSSPILTDKLAIVTAEPNFLVAINRADGKQLWKVAITPANLADPKTRKAAEEYVLPKAGSGMAAATPITDGRNIYFALANGIVAAVDVSGKIQWTTYIDAEQNTGYGRSASPLLVAGKLIVHMTNLYAFDPATGKQIWVNTSAASSYGSPAALRIGSVDLIVTPKGSVVRADTGMTVAEDIGHSGNPTPIARDGTIYFGDVAVSAVRLKAAFKDEELWNATIADDVFGSPLLHDGILFVATGKGDLFTFHSIGKGEQAPLSKPMPLFGDSGEGDSYASLTLAGKFIFLNSNQGDIVMLEATQEVKVVARGKLPEGSGASPVFSGTEMFLRSGDKLMCIGE